MSNWLHISPTTGRGSTQMTISADTNDTPNIRKAKIIVTAGTLSKTIEVIQYPMAGDIMCTYNQAPSGVKLINTIGILDAVVVSSEYGSVRLTGSSLNQLTANTVYTFSGQTPSQLTVNYYLNSNFNNTLTRDIFRDLNGLVSVSIVNKVNTLSEPFYNNMNLERIDMYSGVTGYSMGVDYEVGGSVVYMCPKLYQFTGDSPLIYNQNMLKYQNKVIGVTLGSVSSVNIPEGVTGLTYGLCEIPSGYPNTISAVTLPSTLKTIDGHCFGNLNITGLSIPSSVTSIGLNVFSGCTQLTAITANNATCSAVTISPTTFYQIATGGTLYYPEGSDYSSWLSEDEYYLGYYLWKDSRAFALENVSTYYMQFQGNVSGSGVSQSVFVTANKPDYQVSVSDVQSLTGTGVTWLAVSGTPASGTTEFKIYPTTTAETQRNCWVQISYSGEIYATISIIQTSGSTGETSITVAPSSLSFASGATGSSSAQSVTVTSNVVYAVENNNSWLSVIGTPNTGTTTLTLYPNSTNAGNTDRTGTINIKYNNNIYQVITVTQAHGSGGVEPSITVTPSSLMFTSGATGSSSAQSVTVTSNVSYTISNSNNWFAVCGQTGTGTTVLQVYPTQNNTGSVDKNGYFRLLYGTNEAVTVYVTHYAGTGGTGFEIMGVCDGYDGFYFVMVDGYDSSTNTINIYSPNSWLLKHINGGYPSDVVVTPTLSRDYTVMPSGQTIITVQHGIGTQGTERWLADFQFYKNTSQQGQPNYIYLTQYGNVTTGKYIRLGQTTFNVGASSGTYSTTAEFNVNVGCRFNVPHFIEHVDWTTDSNYFTFTVSENTTGAVRQSTFYFEYWDECDSEGVWDTPKSITITVTQSA